MSKSEQLRFRVTPHILEDLGLNLYTSLARVLVEFIANAYDADADAVNLSLNKDQLEEARRQLREQYRKEANPDSRRPLASRELPPQYSISIIDDGHGMSRNDLQDKFLLAGRRRREEEPELNGRTPDKRRPLMGRKGLGKLAGFGVARRVSVVSWRADSSEATKITLDYDEILKHKTTDNITVPTETLTKKGLPSKSGTQITLSRLLYDPIKNKEDTIKKEISEYFEFVKPSDFQISIDDTPLHRRRRSYAWAWPEPETIKPGKLVSKTVDVEEEDRTFTFKYRLRFTGDGEALPASKRGVRVYVNGRLAAAPSLLDANTNMHGFRMTDYLDGVIVADGLAEEKQDYIATDRQALLWETPLLSEVRKFVSEEIKTACARYQSHRDEEKRVRARDDEYTKNLVESLPLSSGQRATAYKIAGVLASAYTGGFEDNSYQTVLPVVVKGLGHGEILGLMNQLSKDPNPQLASVATTIARLTLEEFEQFRVIIHGRLDGIVALKKIVRGQNFAAPENEGELQKLFEKNPWLLEPTYSQFLTANQTRSTLYEKLKERLAIGAYAGKPKANPSERPDLVSLIGNDALSELVIIELKSANIPLQSDHLDQLIAYMEDAEEFLKENGRHNVDVRGQLIGTIDTKSSAQKVTALRSRVRREQPKSQWRVRTYIQVLEDTERVHSELLLARGDE